MTNPLRSKDVNSLHPENILAVEKTFFVVNFSLLISIFVNFLQSSNIPSIYWTYLVLKYVKSKFVICAQPLNISESFVASATVKSLPNLISVNARHPLNILLKSLTYFVLNLSNPFIVVRLLHPSNIEFIFRTFSVEKLFISKYLIFVHNLNISEVSVQDSVLNLDISNEVILLQEANIKYISETWSVIKWVTSKLSNFSSPKNIEAISLALLVLNVDISKYSNSVHIANIPLKFCTLDVSNDLSSNLFSLWHPPNKLNISVTFEVSKSLKSKEVRALHEANILFIVLALFVLNPDTSNFSNTKQLHAKLSKNSTFSTLNPLTSTSFNTIFW